MRKTRVALIDSGVDLSDVYFFDKDITAVKINGTNVINSYDDLSGHGTDIAKIIFEHSSYVSLLSIKILDKDNKSTVESLQTALKYCIKENVDVINLSLGSRNLSRKSLRAIETICNLAVRKGIAIISSNNNDGDIPSCPYNLQQVIGVKFEKKQGERIDINFSSRNITFNSDLIYINCKKQSKFRKGNSFLTPIVTGMFCEFNKEYQGKDVQEDFIRFINNEIKPYLDFIYLDRNFHTGFSGISNKKIGYLYLRITESDEKIIGTLEDLEATVEKIRFSKVQDYNEMRDIDFLFLGESCSPKHCGSIQEIINLVTDVVSQKKNIVMIFPILNIYSRIAYYRRYGTLIQSVY